MEVNFIQFLDKIKTRTSFLEKAIFWDGFKLNIGNKVAKIFNVILYTCALMHLFLVFNLNVSNTVHFQENRTKCQCSG
jgi:hypothetical protein